MLWTLPTEILTLPTDLCIEYLTGALIKKILYFNNALLQKFYDL